MVKCKDCSSSKVEEYTRSDGSHDYYCSGCGSRRKPYGEFKRKVLVIPDLHFPFVREGYLEFLTDVYDKYNCNTVVQIGDILDMHYSSFHDADPDGLSANEEFDNALNEITRLAEVFPNIKVCGGNHDNIPARRAFSAGLSTRWVKPIKDVLLDAGAPVEGWDFSHNHIIDGIKYTHGTARKARQRMLQDGISIVQGHYHSESYIHFHVNAFQKNFAMQVGALTDDRAYAFAYGKEFARSHKNCGVVVDGVPTLEYMNL